MIECFRIQRLGTDAEFCWVPAHTGLKGNEFAERMAKREQI